MKKLRLLPMLIPMLFAACSSEEPVSIKDTERGVNECRTIDEAKELASELPALFGHESRHSKICDDVVILRRESRSNDEALIYAVNYKDNEGYALIAANKNIDPIIGYVEKGAFTPIDQNTNENFVYYLDAALDYVSNDGFEIRPGGDWAERPVTFTYMVFPRVDVEWGQRYPEGIYCSNGVSGCGQTAEAQILSYIELPKTVALNYPERDKDVLNLDWTSLKKHVKSTSVSQKSAHLSTCEANEAIHNDLGRLCRQLGYSNCASYDTSSTGTSPSFLRSQMFRMLGDKVTEFKAFTTDGELYKELDKSESVAFFCGYDKSAGGHAWVCDGGMNKETTSYLTLIDGTKEKIVKNIYYYHFNWGWNGSDNGYFAEGVFDTAKPTSRYDFSSNVSYFLVYK